MSRKVRPEFFTTADVAAVKDVTPHAVSRMIYAARREFDRKGAWPEWTPPAPEPREGARGPLRWRADRKDVQRWLADPSRKVWK